MLEQNCNRLHCTICAALFPVDGGWSPWSPWTECSASCDGGTRERTRECNNPSPKNGGKDCEGDKTETESCNEQPCAIESKPLLANEVL